MKGFIIKLKKSIMENKKMTTAVCIAFAFLITMTLFIVMNSGKSEPGSGINETGTTPGDTANISATPTKTVPPINVTTGNSAKNTATGTEENPGVTPDLDVSGNPGENPNNSNTAVPTNSQTQTKTTGTAKPTATPKPPSVTVTVSTPKPTPTPTPVPTPRPLIGEVTVMTQNDINKGWVEPPNINTIIKESSNVFPTFYTIDYRAIDEWRKANYYYHEIPESPWKTTNAPFDFDKMASDAKKYNIVSKAEFVPDSNNTVLQGFVYEMGFYRLFVRGTLYLRYSAPTDTNYLKENGFKIDTWYSKRIDVVITNPISASHPFYTPEWEIGEYIYRYHADLTEWKETKR